MNGILRRASLQQAISGVIVLLAAGIVILTLIPSSVWRHPAVDATYRGFDPNLIFISRSGPATSNGEVTVRPDALTINANPDSRPLAHLVTSPLKYSASFDAKVTSESPGSIPLRVEVWSPETMAGYILAFDARGDVIREETVSRSATRSMDLIEGTPGNERVLGHYVVGKQYHVTLNVDPVARSLAVKIVGADLSEVSSGVTASDAAGVFEAFRPTLTVSSSASDGSSSVVLRNYRVTLPSQPSNTAEPVVKVDDPLAHALALVLWLAAIAVSVVVTGTAIATWLKARRPAPESRSLFGKRLTVAVVVGFVGAVYLAANVPLFALATNHFDVFGAKVWAYVASNLSITDLYNRTLLIPSAMPWLGVPMHESGFPYGVTKAYYYLGLGWINHLLLNRSGWETVSSFSFEQLVKASNVLFALVDSLLIYLIVKPVVDRSNAILALALFALNPAVVFVMSVWGATETVSIFFVLSSIWLAEKQKPVGAWIMLAAAAYTRPQMIVFAFLLGLVYLRKFSVRANLNAIPPAVIVAFVFIGPFALDISPSLPIDYVTRTFSYHIGNQQTDSRYLAISPGYYSIWTLPLLLVNGQHGLQRMWWPPSEVLVGPWNYGQIGAFLSVGVVLGAGALILFGSRSSMQHGQYLPVVALGMSAWLLVTPNLISRYIVYAILAVILCRGAFSLGSYLTAIGVLSAATMVGTFGQLALDYLGYSGNLDILSPTNNPISGFLFDVFSADWFITLASVSSVAVLILLGARAWQSLRGERFPDLALAINNRT